MSLIICKECGKEFSDKAAACPNCGAPIEFEAPVIQTEKIFKPGFLQPVNGMTIDKKNRTFRCGILGEVHSFDEIIDVDIHENGSSMTKTNTGSMIGRAAVGSAFGPLGTLVGGVTAKKKTVEIINSMEVCLTVVSERKPLIKINIPIPKKTKKDSKDYQKAFKKAQETVAFIKNMQLNK